MRTVTSAAALAIAALALTACDKPATQTTAYNNSGSSATPGSTTAGTAGSTAPSPTTSTTTPDTAAPNAPATASMAPGPAGDATGAVSETITTGKIKAAIAADAGLKDTDISVTTNNGVVTLSGTAKSQDQVSAATALAQRQEGVTKVETTVAVK